MKAVRYIAIFIIALVAVSDSYAQAPAFTYPDNESYSFTRGKTITPLLPNNTGGAIPATPFGKVTNYAGASTIPGQADGNTTAARFRSPHDLVRDAQGNIYVADAGNNLIRKIAPNGDVTTIAGTSAQGSLDGLALLATFNNPIGLAMDKDGNIFVADRDNHTIRKITPAGTVQTLAGTAGQSGLVNSQGSFARFNQPTGITVDRFGGLLVADYGNNAVRHVGQDGTTNLTAGSGEYNWVEGSGTAASFSGPTGILDIGNGLTYVADYSHIRSLDENRNVNTVAGNFFTGQIDGYGKGALIKDPTCMVKDAAGVVWITEGNGGAIIRFDPSGEIKTIVTSPFVRPTGIAIDDNGLLYVADEGAHVIRTVYTTGYTISPALPAGLVFDQSTGMISGTPTETRQMSNYSIIGYNTTGKFAKLIQLEVRETNLKPQQITFDPLPVVTVGDQDMPPGATSTNPNIPIDYTSSDLNIAFISNGKIHFIAQGEVDITAYQRGDVDYAAAEPVTQHLKILPAPELDKPTVTVKPGPMIFPLDKTGSVTIKPEDIASIVPGPQKPDIVTTIRPLSVFTCDDLGDQVVTVGGGYGLDPADPLNAEFDQPAAMAFDPFGNLYISDQAYYKVRKYNIDTRVTTIAGGISGFRDGKGGNVAFGRGLSSVATDSHGNIYVCDPFNNALRKVDPDGNSTTVAADALKTANGGIFTPNAVAVDGNDNVFVANATRIFKITPDGQTVTLFAGSGAAANTEGVGPTASFNGIKGLYFDKAGDLYVSTSDLGKSNTIRKVSPAGVTTTVISVSYAANFTRLVVDSKGMIFVASSSPVIYRITQNGQISNYAGSTQGYKDGPKATAQFNNPQGIAIDAKDNLYIADSDNHRLRMITAAGKVITIAGNGTPGPSDNSNRSNAAKVTVTIKIVSSLDFITTQNNVSVPATAQCPAVVPDYTKDAKAQSTCAHSITVTQSPAAGTPVSAGQTIKVTLTAMDDLGQSTMQDFDFTAADVPAPTVSIAPQTEGACDGAPVTFKATATGQGTHATYEWKLNGVVQSVTGDTFTDTKPANHDNVTCTVYNNDHCSPIASAEPAVYNVNTEAAVNTSLVITPSITEAICPGVGVTFTALPGNVQAASASPTYQWKVNGENRGSNSATFTAYNLRDQDVVTCEMDSHVKCSAMPITVSNAITMQVKSDEECSIKIPNTFTPNGDGINDIWEIPELSNFPDCVFTVYNRYGKTVYRSVGYDKPWDGTYKGARLAAGTYYYIIDLKTGRPTLSGSVTILK